MTNSNRDSRIDEYMANAQEFAMPIMAYLRDLLHRHCPDVVETVKWSIPHFDYKGEMMCVFAAHKSHCSFTFLKGSIMSDPKLRANPGLPAVKRYMGKITTLDDLPSEEQLAAYIKEAMELNEKGVKLLPRTSEKPKEIAVPNYFTERLVANPQAKAVFESKSDAFRKDYLVWITNAKTDATREKRIVDSLEWIAQGKSRFWKYEKR